MADSDKNKGKNVKVVVRIRPTVPAEAGPSVVRAGNRSKTLMFNNKNYNFDKVFGESATQEDVYAVVKPRLDDILYGYNCTVFAYGQTGTGKTFTMLGERTPGRTYANDPLLGIVPRVLHDLFAELDRTKATQESSVTVSHIELYNENIYDLHAKDDIVETIKSQRSKLKLFESDRKVTIAGLTDVPVANVEEVLAVMERGNARRQTAATLLNEASSRSHSIFTISVQQRQTALERQHIVVTGNMYLVDLAGSENIAKSGAVDERAKETRNINTSLFTLGRVIVALTENSPHVPYRDSKLTRLLQHSLGGENITTLIATISPSALNSDETLNTLEYASRAKQIVNQPSINSKVTVSDMLHIMQERYRALMNDVTANQKMSGVYMARENYELIQQQNDEMAERIAGLAVDLEAAQRDYALMVERIEKVTAFQNEQYTRLYDRHVETERQSSDLRSALLETTTKLCRTENLLNIERSVTELLQSHSVQQNEESARLRVEAQDMQAQLLAIQRERDAIAAANVRATESVVQIQSAQCDTLRTLLTDARTKVADRCAETSGAIVCVKSAHELCVQSVRAAITQLAALSMHINDTVIPKLADIETTTGVLSEAADVVATIDANALHLTQTTLQHIVPLTLPTVLTPLKVTTLRNDFLESAVDFETMTPRRLPTSMATLLEHKRRSTLYTPGTMVARAKEMNENNAVSISSDDDDSFAGPAIHHQRAIAEVEDTTLCAEKVLRTPTSDGSYAAHKANAVVRSPFKDVNHAPLSNVRTRRISPLPSGSVRSRQPSPLAPTTGKPAVAPKGMKVTTAAGVGIKLPLVKPALPAIGTDGKKQHLFRRV